MAELAKYTNRYGFSLADINDNESTEHRFWLVFPLFLEYLNSDRESGLLPTCS